MYEHVNMLLSACDITVRLGREQFHSEGCAWRAAPEPTMDVKVIGPMGADLWVDLSLIHI